jgi:hypothetical protein
MSDDRSDDRDFDAFMIEAKLLRQLLESVFSKETAAPGTPNTPNTIPSAGHCAVSSIIVDCLLGPSAGSVGSCQFVSTKVKLGDRPSETPGETFSKTPGKTPGETPLEVSHWFNRITFPYYTPYGQVIDIDLTGDQFGLPGIQIAPAGSLYKNTVVRDETSLTQETLDRAFLLLERVKVLLDAKAEALGIYGDDAESDSFDSED